MKRPNIVILNPDQMRADSMHHLGNDASVTPVLDRLATEGISFSRAFCQNPVCTPSPCCRTSDNDPYDASVGAGAFEGVKGFGLSCLDESAQ